MQLRRFYIDPDRFGNKVELSPEQTRHLSRVLRLGTGEDISVFDGCGRESIFRIVDTAPSGASVEFVEDIPPMSPESDIAIELAVPLLKKAHTELVLQKAVELGVSRFVPLITKRTEARTSAWKAERAFRIAVEAAKQSGRATVPIIESPRDFESFVEGFNGTGFLFYESEGSVLPDSIDNESVTVITGPEGGWDETEIETARGAGFEIVHLGGRILKAETAAIVATALVQEKFGDLN
ncbi:MAG: 16S rRNA (uracil(1498)-N(3))-methyltransferase [Pyrinomonadaceae bacterium]|nr:16S rRNA (uracil(1498)-N(3))-methyltransferase [Pyrinomonadaceae bacterium]